MCAEHQPQHVRVPGDFECFPSDRLLTHLLRLVLRTQPRSGTRKTLLQMACVLLGLLIEMNCAAKFSLPVILALAVAFLTGCKTPPPINWDSRVGHYTYAQAVTELGPPARQARLSDGKAVYKWFVQPLVAPHFNSGMSYYGSTGFGAGPTIGASIKNEMLQLTFDTNGTLIAWSKTN